VSVDQFGKLTLRHAGRLHHIGIINAATGELIRQLTLDPTRDYQPRGVPTGRPKKKPEP
jgi:hypothetical protein